jgi:hypothetical protein
MGSYEPPSDRERAKLLRRQTRLKAKAKSVVKATEAIRVVAPPPGTWVGVRNSFVDTGVPVSAQRRGDPSDRRLPDKEDRPPATRIMSPRGAALRVFLAALLERQARTRPGNRLPIAGGGNGSVSWVDLLASEATSSGTGKYYMSESAKKIRQLENTLDRLAAEELVAFTSGKKPGTGKYERFKLMNEGGRRATGPNVEYELPDPKQEAVFGIPVALFTSGWLHVLEDTELAFLLMVMRCSHSMAGVPFRIPAADRLLRFGIGRDAYDAHVLLSELGLITVTEDPGRHVDGKVKDYGAGGMALPHTLSFNPAGFDRDGLSALHSAIDNLLGR